MKTMRKRVAMYLLLAAGLLPGVAGVPSRSASGIEDLRQHEEQAEATSSGLVYRVSAGNARRNRRLMGLPERFVQGVPAEPVNSFVYDGVGSEPIEGNLTLQIDPLRNTGYIKASWTDEHGDWTYDQTRFVHPEHASGVRIGSSVTLIETILNEGTAHNVYLHGDTTAGMGVLPTVFNHLAAWGPADVTLNGQSFRNPYEIPAPQWIGHAMVSEGARRSDGTVRTMTGEIYNPREMDNGEVEPGDLEVHLTFHDDIYPLTQNMPPLFSFFYHLLFEDVRIEIIHEEERPKPGPPITVPERMGRSGR